MVFQFYSKKDPYQCLWVDQIFFRRTTIKTIVTGYLQNIVHILCSIQFVRMSDDDKLEDVIILMKDYWNLLNPKAPLLGISVIGGAKSFHLRGIKKENFCKVISAENNSLECRVSSVRLVLRMHGFLHLASVLELFQQLVTLLKMLNPIMSAAKIYPKKYDVLVSPLGVMF